MPKGEVDLAPFREAFERSPMTVKDVARRMRVDESRVRQLLGKKGHYTYKKGKRFGPYRCKRASYPLAVRLADAMQLDYTEVDI